MIITGSIDRTTRLYNIFCVAGYVLNFWATVLNLNVLLFRSHNHLVSPIMTCILLVVCGAYTVYWSRWLSKGGV